LKNTWNAKGNGENKIVIAGYRWLNEMKNTGKCIDQIRQCNKFRDMIREWKCIFCGEVL
jgi:hypothetical protein